MFQFKFKAVLDYRRQIEDTCLQAFAQSKKEWEKQLRRLEQDYECWKKCLEEWRGLQEDTVSILQVELYQRYMLRLRREITEQAERVKTCLGEMDQKRALLLSARRDKKIMEKLKETHFMAYSREQAKKESKFLDEISTLRFNRTAGNRE